MRALIAKASCGRIDFEHSVPLFGAIGQGQDSRCADTSSFDATTQNNWKPAVETADRSDCLPGLLRDVERLEHVGFQSARFVRSR